MRPNSMPRDPKGGMPTRAWLHPHARYSDDSHHASRQTDWSIQRSSGVTEECDSRRAAHVFVRCVEDTGVSTKCPAAEAIESKVGKQMPTVAACAANEKLGIDRMGAMGQSSCCRTVTRRAAAVATQKPSAEPPRSCLFTCEIDAQVLVLKLHCLNTTNIAKWGM